jgi:hypothetical protein
MAAPKTINPAGSKIPFSVVSANHLDQEGRKAELRLTIEPVGFQDGTNLKLDFLGQTWQFDFKDIPDDSDTQLSAKVLAMSFDDWFAILINELNLNRFIFPYYSVIKTGTANIQFNAKEEGETYNIELGEANPVVSLETRVAGLDEIAKMNFGVHAEVIQITTGGQEVVLGQDRLGGNDVEFNFQQYLALIVKSTLYFPQVIDDWKKSSTEAVQKFFIRHWERAANYFSAISETAQYSVIGGGLTKLHEKLILEDAISYVDLMKSGDILIQSNRALLSTIHYKQPLQFYFINHYAEVITFLARLKIVYTDSTNVYPSLNGGNTLKLNPNEQGCFIISPEIHKLDEIHPDKTIDSLEFEIWQDLEKVTDFITRVEADGGTIEGVYELREELLSLGDLPPKKSETFIMQLKESDFERSIIFLNSFDTWETASFLGISELTDNYTRLFFEALSTKIQTKVAEKEIFRLNSGWLNSLAERNSLRDLIRSPEIYLIDGNNLFRANITTNESLRHIDKEYRYSLQIELELTGDNKYYSARQADSMQTGIIIADDNFIISDGFNTIGY